jgi:putative protein-disulfide isomerase
MRWPNGGRHTNEIGPAMETVAAPEPRHHFLYFADPMCSWCYGFSPVIRELEAHFAGRLPVRTIVGGLRAGNTQAMREQDRDYIRNAWTRVGEATGRSFDFAFFDREHFVYDTEPACRAVVTMRGRHPDKTVAFMGAISEAFYGNNRDTTDTDVLCAVAGEQSDDADAFRAQILAADTRTETARDFHFANQSGVHGFPCLMIGGGTDGYALVTNGYRPIDGLPEAIDRWLEKIDEVQPA